MRFLALHLCRPPSARQRARVYMCTVAACFAMPRWGLAQRANGTDPSETLASRGDQTDSASQAPPAVKPFLVYSPMTARVPLADVNGKPRPILLAPRRLPYDGGPVPRGYVVESYSFWPLWVGGIGALVGGWALANLAVGFGGDKQLSIPIVGPWLELAERDSKGHGFLIASGAGQALGVAAITTGLSIWRQRLVRADLAAVRFTPVVSAEGLGASIDARW